VKADVGRTEVDASRAQALRVAAIVVKDFTELKNAIETKRQGQVAIEIEAVTDKNGIR